MTLHMGLQQYLICKSNSPFGDYPMQKVNKDGSDEDYKNMGPGRKLCSKGTGIILKVGQWRNSPCLHIPIQISPA